MTSRGGPHARFKRALATGNLLLIRAAAAELPQVPLDDALRICLLLRRAKSASYDRAVVRWLGRFCLERPAATLDDVLAAVGAFERMPSEPKSSVQLLERVMDRTT